MIARYVGLAVGTWYLTAPFVWGYDVPFLWWHDLVIGAAVIALSAAFLLAWSRLAAWLLILLGAYSMSAPFLHGYLPHSFAFWNDLVAGVLTVGVGAALAAAALEYGTRARAEG